MPNYNSTLKQLYEYYLKLGAPESLAKSLALWKRRNNANAYNMILRKQILNDESVCVKCGSKERLQLDHIVPVSKDGKNELSNIQILCQTCNNKKRVKIPPIFQ